jgi:hypothetical protein
MTILSFFLWSLAGVGIGLIVVPIIMWVCVIIRNAKQRREVKRLIKQNKFLIPIDAKDYDVEAWKNQKHGNIDNSLYTQEAIDIDNKVYKRDKIREVQND